MCFVRMKHEHLAGNAVLGRAPVAKGLDAMDREADRVGVVTVRVEAVAREERFDPFEPPA